MPHHKEPRLDSPSPKTRTKQELWKFDRHVPRSTIADGEGPRIAGFQPARRPFCRSAIERVDGLLPGGGGCRSRAGMKPCGEGLDVETAVSAAAFVAAVTTPHFARTRSGKGASWSG